MFANKHDRYKCRGPKPIRTTWTSRPPPRYGSHSPAASDFIYLLPTRVALGFRGQVAANLHTIHLDLEDNLMGKYKLFSLLESLAPRLTALKCFTFNTIILDYDEWSEVYSSWIYGYSGEAHWILQLNHLLGVKGRWAFKVIRDGKTIDLHRVIEMWTWEAKKDQVLKKSEYVTELCR